MKDTFLAEEVNLIPKEGLEVPADLYETSPALFPLLYRGPERERTPINEEIRKIGRENTLYSNLENVNLTRKDVKHPIMTKTYNVSPFGIKDQLISNFTKIVPVNTNLLKMVKKLLI